MSYILDALRKADAQRERDPARGIHAQPVQAMPADRADAARSRIWLWIALCAGLASLAAAAWHLASPDTGPALRAAGPAVASGPLTVPAPVLPATPAPAVLPAPPPVAAAPPVREVPKAPRVPIAAAVPDAERLLPAKELPADIPKLAITGGVYSGNPSQRMLIVNGQVVNEGAQLAPDVVLEQIRPRTAVLRVRGYRYSVGY